MDVKAFAIGIIVVVLGVAGGIYLASYITRMQTGSPGGAGY